MGKGLDSFFDKRAFATLTGFSIIKVLLLILISLTSWIALAPDEAQYWTWSRALDFGYYSKPPAISWQIFLTTALFGNHELGIRMGAILMGTALAYAIFFVAKRAQLSDRAALYAALAFAFSPMGFYLSFATTTDGGAILFLMLALLPLVSALSQQKSPNYFLVGLFIAFGALFKWTIYFLWPLILMSLLFFPLLRSKKLLGGVLLSLLGLLPSVYWNWMHEWATFKHVFSTLVVPSSHKKGGNCLAYLAAQVALFFPLFAAALPFAFKTKNKSLRFLFLFIVSALGMVLIALTKKMQPNWALFLYPPCMILVGSVLAERGRWFWSSLCLSCITIGISLLIPPIQNQTSYPLSYKLNPYQQTMGVRQLGELLVQGGYQSESDFIFSDRYQNSALLSFYGPERKRAYFFNLGGARKNQFSYWPQMEESEKGNCGYFVIIENGSMERLQEYERKYCTRLAPYFTSVTYVGARELFAAQGEGVKFAMLFRCEEYNGQVPTPSKQY